MKTSSPPSLHFESIVEKVPPLPLVVWTASLSGGGGQTSKRGEGRRAGPEPLWETQSPGRGERERAATVGSALAIMYFWEILTLQYFSCCIK